MTGDNVCTPYLDDCAESCTTGRVYISLQAAKHRVRPCRNQTIYQEEQLVLGNCISLPWNGSDMSVLKPSSDTCC